MDPLSFTASLLTVIGTAGVIGNGLKKIVALRNAPKILLALRYEVANLYCILQAVEHLIKQHAETTHAGPIECLNRALENSQESLFSLEKLMKEKLVIEGKGSDTRLDRSVWLFSSSKVQKIKDQIRSNRIDLAFALNLLASSTSHAVEIKVEQLCFSVQTLGDHLIGGALASQVEDLMSRRRYFQDVNNEHNNTFQSTDAATTQEGPMSTSDPNESSSTSLKGLSRQSTLVEEPQRQLGTTRSWPTKLSQSTCSLDCSCACHRRNRLKSPDILNFFFGSLSVGYKLWPWASPGCDKKYCRSRSTSITYAFPQWFMSRAISMTMAYSHSQGPELSLRMMRVRSGDADIFMAVFRGASHHIGRLLKDGEASVLDVDPAGNTALQWAVRRMDLPTVELLINEGSDLYFENSSGSFPYSMAWEQILGEPQRWKKEDLDLLELLFHDESGLALFHFSELHRACLGLSSKTLEDVLSFTPNAMINEVDNTGRTALSWAAQRGDSSAVEKLLARGADANRKDHSRRTPLHRSVAADSNACMHLLLRHDADVNAKDDYGRTTLSNVASRKKDTSFVETLTRFGADMETEDDEGWRPLHWASHKNQPITLARLLDDEADSNATDRNGRNALHLSILRNCHKTMKVLVDKNACGQPGKSALGSNVLHSAACYGDIETLKILQSATLGGFDTMDENANGFTAQGIAEWRRDGNEDWANSSFQPCDSDPLEWYTAFKAFMGNVTKGQDQDSGEGKGEWDLIGVRLTESVSSEWETIEQGDGQDVWEDAQESTDESSNPETVA